MSTDKSQHKSAEIQPISLPCLRGRVGDWFYYVTLLPFSEVAKRVKQPMEIDKKYEDENLKLGEWIQRKLEGKRINPIVDYIEKHKERFFNSLVLGIYDGEPSWQDINVKYQSKYDDETELTLDSFSKTFGILTLSGKESIFAIDGQHRAMGIRKAFLAKKTDANDEIPVVIVAHSTDEEGKITTRRLFSTLNRYAKPVSQSEKIALSEDDNCAIITRRLVDEHELLIGRVLVNKSRSINPVQVDYFTNVMVLYDIVSTILVEKRVAGFGMVPGKSSADYLHLRASTTILEDDYKIVSQVMTTLLTKVPDLADFVNNGKDAERTNEGGSLLFRPIGQNIFFDIWKVANDAGQSNKVFDYFASIDFSYRNPVWKKIFYDEDSGEISTDKKRQRFVTMLILEKLGFHIKRNKKEVELLQSFGVNASMI